jgi:uncharacterized membrane protein YphA (DoxX/SURF4 family)
VPARMLAYWITTVLAALLFTVPGIGLIGHIPHFMEDMSRLGYPPYFPTILGIWKILGAAAILAPGLPRLKEWAYAGMVFDLSGATLSHLIIGGMVVKSVVPSLIACIVIASWKLRTGSRVLRKAA